MAKKGLTLANTLRSNNTTSTGYGIVYADEIIGSRSVKTRKDLDKLPDWVLGKDNKLEKGTTYYVENEKCFYIYTGDGWQKSFKSIGLPVKSWYAYDNDVTGTAATSQILDISKIINGDDLYVGTLNGIEEQPHPFATIVVYNDEVNKVPIAYITLFESSDPDNPENNTVVASAKVFGVVTNNVFPKTPNFSSINYYEGNCRPLDTGSLITNWKLIGGNSIINKVWELNDFSIKGNTIKTSEIDFTTDTLQKFNDSMSSGNHVIKTQYFVVDVTHDNIVGQMLLIGDSLGHMVTEILTTSAELKDGVIDWNAHSDTEVNTYIRRNHVKEGGTSSIAVGSWSKWTYYSGEGQYNDFKILVARELSKKVNTSDVVQQTGDSTTSVMSQKAISDKLNAVDKKFTEENNRVNVELGKKFDKVSVVQESGDAEDKVMSQKAVSYKFREFSEINNSITKGKAVNIEGEIVDSNDYNATIFYISIDNIKSFSVISQNLFPCLVYYDSNLKYISYVMAPSTDLVTYTESVLKNKPSNAKYVRFCYRVKPFKLELYTGNPNINDNLIEFVDNKIKTVTKDSKIKDTVSLLTKGKYLDLKGQIKNSNEFIATIFYISIDNIKSFSVVGQGTSLAIAYYDSNLKFISGIEGAGWGGHAFTESVLQDKPINAKYVRFSSHTEIAPFKLELYTVNPNINDSLIELVDNKITNRFTGTKAWENKTCAFLGDSITDKVHVGTTKNYWQFLGEILGISYVSYGINGAQSDSLINQATSAYNDNPNYDAIFILIGTNDFNANIRIGDWFTETEKETNKNGVSVNLKHRDIIINNNTFKGRLNTGLQYIKKKFPNSQVILMTPLHRAYAVFDPSNIQPDESYANTSGLFLSDYVAAIKEAANIWATELIDLNAISGLYPLMEEYSGYFHNSKTDMLHPNINGHYRMAQAIAAKMNSISCLQKP